LPQGSDKQNLLGVIDRASRFVRLPRLLACIGISSSRYYDWKNAQECGLDDVSSCPKALPGQMTATERSEMRSMVQSEDYRHLSEHKQKGHAQQLRWTQWNSESNAKTIGDRTSADGEFVFSTTAKASKDETSHDCRGRIRTDFDRLGRTAIPIEFFRSV
jgi:predicted DNA-binding transcriptional regulator AlpA